MPRPLYAQLLAEFGDSPRAAILCAAKHGSEAQYIAEGALGERNYHLNGMQNDPSWNGGGGSIVDPVPDH